MTQYQRRDTKPTATGTCRPAASGLCWSPLMCTKLIYRQLHCTPRKASGKRFMNVYAGCTCTSFSFLQASSDKCVRDDRYGIMSSTNPTLTYKTIQGETQLQTIYTRTWMMQKRKEKKQKQHHYYTPSISKYNYF